MLLAFFAVFGSPQALFHINGRRRDHAMDMRVVIEASGMGVQYRDGAGIPFELRVVLRESFQGLPATAGHQAVKGTLLLPGQRSEFLWKGEGHPKIVGGHLPLQLPFQPLLRFVRQAMRAVSMAAGMRDADVLGAVATLCQHDGALRGATLLHGG